MNLYFLRHGIAVERGTPGFTRDSDRPLTPEGRAKTRRIATAMKMLSLDFDLILSSPFVRARQTAQIVAVVFKRGKSLALTDRLAPGASLRALVAELKCRYAKKKNVLLVGHEPDFSDHISFLLTGKHGLALEMKKAGLCKLTVDTLRCGRCATLECLLPPRVLAAVK